MRNSKDEDAQFNIFGVTPEFQKYIGKHLSAILDKKLEKCIESEIFNGKPIEKHISGGIKLFSNSENFLETPEYQSDSNINLRNRKKPLEKLPINKEDLKNLAVSGEAILQKEDLKYWSTRTKGKVFSYKKIDNGQLILI